MNGEKNVVRRNKKLVFCFIMISLLSEISADFVLGSISDKLAIQIQETQQLVVQAQNKVEEQKALTQAPASMIVEEKPDGSKEVTVYASATIGLGASVSGEIIRTYLLQIVDLVALKNLYDLWKSYVDIILEVKITLILILSAVFLMQQSKRVLRVF